MGGIHDPTHRFDSHRTVIWHHAGRGARIGGRCDARTGASSYRSLDLFPAGCPVCGGTTFSQTNVGYVAGLGFDWMPWHNNWIVRVEYLYHNLGGATATASLQSPLAGVAGYAPASPPLQVGGAKIYIWSGAAGPDSDQGRCTIEQR
jgi:hypothetical protein